MTRTGLDSTSMVPPSGHRSVGSTVALRYLSRFTSKVITTSERGIYRANHIDLVSVFEDFATNALKGASQGEADARFAFAQAQRLGLPGDRPVFFAVDFDETPAQAKAVASYFEGIHRVVPLPRIGVYGGYWVVKRLFDEQLVSYGWQTYAWSGGNFDKRAQVYQYSNGHSVAGVGVDYDHCFGSDFGQWDHATPKPPPRPKPAQGIAVAEVQYDLGKKELRLQPKPPLRPITWDEKDSQAKLELTLDTGGKNAGHWTTKVM